MLGTILGIRRKGCRDSRLASKVKAEPGLTKSDEEQVTSSES